MPRAKKKTAKKITKADFIRSQPKNLPAAEVVKRAKKLGLDISEKYVYTSRSLDRNGAKQKKAKVAKKRVAKKRIAKSKVTKKPTKEARDSDPSAPAGRGGTKPIRSSVKSAAVRAVEKKEGRVRMPGGASARGEYAHMLREVEGIDQGELEGYLREVCFRLGLVQVKKLVRKFEKMLDAGAMFPDD